MRLFRSMLVVALLAGSLLAGGPASAAQTITLRVAPEGFVVPSHWAVGNQAVWIVDPANNKAFNGLDGVAGCNLVVPDANGDGRIAGGEVLDRATAAGCISGWDYVVFDCCGRFVTMVDDVEELGWPASWWLVQIDGNAAATGIDGMDLKNGQSLEFVNYFGP